MISKFAYEGEGSKSLILDTLIHKLADILPITFPTCRPENSDEIRTLYEQNKKRGHFFLSSRVAQWKRAGPITQRSVDRNYALLIFF